VGGKRKHAWFLGLNEKKSNFFKLEEGDRKGRQNAPTRVAGGKKKKSCWEREISV